MPEKPATRPPRYPFAPTPLSRAANWFVALAALVLIAVSLGSYFYHRRQLESIAARYLRLVVSGPGELQRGTPGIFNFMATSVTGEPSMTEVKWSLTTPDGRRLVDHRESTDDQGRLTLTVPADMDLPMRAHGAALLSITAGGGASPPSIALPLPIRAERFLTRLWLDRRVYRPGETVYYRSLTVSRYGLVATGPLPLEFEIRDPKSVPLAGSRLAGLTDHGVGNGSFRLPDSLAAGVFTLVARGFEDSFPEERRAFEVLAKAGPKPAATEHAATGASGQGALGAGRVEVEFFPEGGGLAAGMENRVYLAARDARGAPLELRGEVLAGKGASVAKVETGRDGRGVFEISPDAAETYHLQISTPAGVVNSPLLPPASSEQPVAISVKRGVIDPVAALELSLRAAKDRLPLVIAARLRGSPVGQQLLVTSAPDERTHPKVVSLPLDDRAAGLIRVTVYGDATSPAKALAERWVYRRPRKLTVRAVQDEKASDDLSLSVRNEKGQPVAAVLAVTAWDHGEQRPAPDLLRAFLADGGSEDQTLWKGTNLNPSTADDVRALDLALGCQRPRAAGKGDAGKGNAADRPGGGVPESLPLVFDNLSELRAEYETTMSEYRAKRTVVINALIMLGFFGGLALGLLVTMLALLRIVWGSRLWLPTMVAAACCIVVTAVSNEPSRMKPGSATAVGFATCMPGAGTEREQSSAHAENAADSQLRSLADKVVKMEGDAEGLLADRFPLRQYNPAHENPLKGENGPGPLAWYPLLICGADGRVALPGLAPAAGKTLYLWIDAQGEGGMESCEVTVKGGTSGNGSKK